MREQSKIRFGIWLLLTLFLLPLLTFFLWFGRQVSQQHLDHALIEAIKKEDTKTAIELLDQGADANATDKPYQPVTLKSALTDFCNRVKGNRPLRVKKVYPSALLLLFAVHYTNEGHRIQREHVELVNALLSHGSNPSTPDEDGETALYHAANYDHVTTVRILLEHHVNPDVRDKSGNTPLMVASNEDCIRLLIKYGADINIQDNDDQTALFDSAFPFNSQPSKARILLRYGAKIAIKNKDGLTALDYAKKWKVKELIPILEEALKKEQAEQKSSVRTAIK